MWRLLQFLFLGHVHNFTIVDKRVHCVVNDCDKVVAKGTAYTLRCEKCGVLKFEKDLSNI